MTEPSFIWWCSFQNNSLPDYGTKTWANRELLAIKLALEEWRHLLVDHKNHGYLLMAKRPNARQAWWTLFVFSLHYWAGSRNTKADVLSQRYCSATSPDNQGTILPPSCFINTLTWEMSELIGNSLPHHVPEKCPAEHTFVPPCLQARLITWALTIPSMGHPGAQGTYEPLSTKYWWPNMRSEIACFVSSCYTYVMSKTPSYTYGLVNAPSTSNVSMDTHLNRFHYWPAWFPRLHCSFL